MGCNLNIKESIPALGQAGNKKERESGPHGGGWRAACSARCQLRWEIREIAYGALRSLESHSQRRATRLSGQINEPCLCLCEGIICECESSF